MKKINRILVIMLAACIAMSAVGCGSAAPEAAQANPAVASTPVVEATPTPTPKPLTAEELVVAVVTNVQTVDSLDAVMDMELDLEIMGERQATHTKAVITTLNNPLRMKMDMKMEIMEESMDMQMYMEQDGDSFFIYTCVMGEWSRNEVTVDDYNNQMGEYDATGNLELYLKNAKNFEIVGTENIAGVETKKVQGFLSGSDLSETLKETGALEDAMEGMDEMFDVESIWADLGDMPMTVWIDTEKLYPVRFEFDMTGVMAAIYKNMFASMGLEDGMITVHTYNTVMEYSNIGNGTDFTVPAEAKEAA